MWAGSGPKAALCGYARCFSWGLITQEATKRSRQPGGQKGRPELAVSAQQARSVSRRDWLTVLMQDEALFVHDVITGRKYWVLRGRWISVSHTGSRKKITVHGSLAKNDRQLFRTYGWFNTSTFILYLREVQRHFGKAAAITDRAPPHRSKLVRKFLRANRSVRILYFPKGSPHLNAVKEC